MDRIAKYQPYINIDSAIDTSRSYKNSKPVDENSPNYGYNTNIGELDSIFQDDKTIQSYLSNKFNNFEGINAWRLEDFQDGSFLLEFDTDKDYENHKTDYGIGMDFSYEAAIHFFRDEEGTIQAISTFDEDDIKAWQNLQNYEKDTLIFGEYGISQKDIDDENVKILDSTKGILEIKEKVYLDKMSARLKGKTCSIQETDEYNKNPDYLSSKDEQAKMFVHLANPLFEEDDIEISNLLKDIFSAQKEMEEGI